MRLESVRALKQELMATPARRRGGGGGDVGMSTYDVGRPEDLPEPKPAIALGAAPTEQRGDYRLAIRVHDKRLLGSAQVERITAAAGGEVDISFIGIGFKESGGDGTSRARPLEIGCSIGHPRIKAGTLGCFVERDGQVHVLSNNHVLADEDNGKPGDEIVQPGRYDKGSAPADTVARLDRIVPLVVGRGNRVDAATAALVDGVEFDPATIPGLGELSGTSELDGTEKLAKLGRTTRLTRGRIVTLDLDDVPFDYDKGRLYFDNIIEIEGLDGRFTDGGDSGSLVVLDSSSPAGVGLHIGGLPNGNSAVAPLPMVLEELQVTLVT